MKESHSERKMLERFSSVLFLIWVSAFLVTLYFTHARYFTNEICKIKINWYSFLFSHFTISSISFMCVRFKCAAIFTISLIKLIVVGFRITENCMQQSGEDSNKENKIAFYKSQRSRNNTISRCLQITV